MDAADRVRPLPDDAAARRAASAGKAAGIVAIVAASLLVMAAAPRWPAVFAFNMFGIDAGPGLSLAPWFWLGSALRLVDIAAWRPARARIVLSVSVLAVIGWAMVAPHWPGSLVLAIVPIAIAILALGLGDWLHSAAVERIGDLSYGLYLWAFPVQQLVMAKTGGGVGYNIAVALPVTIVLAYGSWHLVEHPALRLKPRRRERPMEEHQPAISEEALQSPAGEAVPSRSSRR